jgi:hypothetical protein
MKGASTERIIEIVRKCPTQALTYDWLDKTRLSDKPGRIQGSNGHETDISSNKPVTVRLIENGPVVVEGSFRVIGSDGKEHESMRIVSFCRCGQSGNMPFCDGTHRRK